MTNPDPTVPQTHLKAAAGGAGGSWYVLLEGLAALVREVHPEIEITVVEGGGVSNHALVGSGEIPMGILNPPMCVAALSGSHPYDRAYEDIRIGVANLTVNYLQFVVAQDVPLNSLDDWFQKRYPLRIPVDRVGTVDRMVFQLSLEHFGVSESSIEDWGSKAVPANDYDTQLSLFRDKAVDALWQFMGIPSPSIAAAHRIRPVKLLPLPARLIAKLEQLGWTTSEIPSGAYSATDEPVATVSMGTSLGFHSSVPDDIVYAITHAICEHPNRVRKIHAAAQVFDPQRAHINGGASLHVGAKRYFGEFEKGITTHCCPP